MAITGDKISLLNFYMKKIFLLLIAIFIISGCSINKQKDKNDDSLNLFNDKPPIIIDNGTPDDPLNIRDNDDKKNTSKQNDKLFEKKQECVKYKNEIEKKWKNEIEYSLQRNIFDEIFYSPTENSCFYSYASYYIDADGKPMDKNLVGIDYIIMNHLTNERVFYANSVINEKATFYFNQRKKEIKK